MTIAGARRPGPLAPVFVLVVLLILAGPAQAQTDEEVYYGDIRSLLISADLHLLSAAEALSSCLETFSSCLDDPSDVNRQMNASRNGLISIHATVLALFVPPRYQAVNQLVLQGLSDSIDGIALHIQGLENQSLDTFQAGSDLLGAGQRELGNAIDLLQSMPPRSSLEELLIWVLLIVAASVAASVGVIWWWYRREVRARSAPEEKRPD